MHPSAMAFAVSALTPANVTGQHVIEAGALNVNGSARPHGESLHPASWTGTDLQPGPGVDLLADAADLPASLGRAGVVIATEMLEHAPDWQAALRGLITAIAPGGILILTTRSAGFPYHPYPGDHWRYSVPAMGTIIRAAGLSVLTLISDPDCPGVFVTARKPDGWDWPPGITAAWDHAGVTAITGPAGIEAI